MTSIDQLLEHPEDVSKVPLGEIRALLVKLGAVITALAARNGFDEDARQAEAAPAHSSPDRCLTVDQVAEILVVDRTWVYRHSQKWPFRLPLSGKTLRFSERGLQKWLETQSRRQQR